MIDTAHALADLVAQGHECQSIALDTEFVWERTYYPRLGLIQVALDVGTCFLIDAPAIPDLAPLGTLLAAPHTLKILHDAPQDLTILGRVTGALPVRIFDTRCVAGLAGLSSTTSLAGVVAATVGVDLAKTESRTDWLQRPLTAEQIQYAAEDVCYLHEVCDDLQRRVEVRGRAAWLREELAALDAPDLYMERDPRFQYLRIKGNGRLGHRETSVLRELAAWREEEARRRDRPRGRVVPDDVLLELARRKPRSREALADVRGLAGRYAEAVIDCVARGMSVAGPDASRVRRRSRAEEKALEDRVAVAMAQVRACAQEEHLDPPFIASRAEVRALVIAGTGASPSEHRLLRGWRYELVGNRLLGLLRNPPDSP